MLKYIKFLNLLFLFSSRLKFNPYVSACLPQEGIYWGSFLSYYKVIHARTQNYCNLR